MKATSWTRQLLLAGIVVLVSGCATTSPIATNTPTPAAPLVVLLGGDLYPTHVSIVDMSGHEVAGADFNAGGGPLVCDAAYVRPPIARIVGRSVYFVDHAGVIRRLDASGATATVMSLPITSSQQQPYFAISPDGKQVMASIVKMPGVNPNFTSLVDCQGTDTSQGVENFTGVAGGTPRSLGAGDYSASAGRATVVAGWDATGPLGTIDTVLSVQNPVPLDRFAGKLVRLDPATGAVVGAPLGGAGCQPVDRLADGTLLCWLANNQLAVRRADGTTVWSVTPPSVASTPALSPDAARIAIEGGVISRGGALTPTAPLTPGGPKSAPSGWIDTGTMVVHDPSQPNLPGSIYLVTAASPGTSSPFGAAGMFVGVIAGS